MARRASLRMSAILCFIVIILYQCPASGATCDEDTIKSVTSDGEMIVMMSGSIFQVLPGDEIDSALWLPASDVMICQRTLKVKGKDTAYYEIINLDDKEKVGALKLK